MGKDIICLYTETCPIYKNWLEIAKKDGTKPSIDAIYKSAADSVYSCLAIIEVKNGNIGNYLKKKLGTVATTTVTCSQIEILNQLERIVSGKGEK